MDNKTKIKQSGSASARASVGSDKSTNKNVNRTHNSTHKSNHKNKFKIKRLEDQVQQYHCTDIYVKAYERKFKTQQALDTFNIWVAANVKYIDPQYMPVCMDCGQCELALCNHFVHTGDDTQGDAAEDNVVVIEQAAPILISRRHRGWVGGVLRWFVTHRDPSFDLNINNNHNCKYFNNEVVPDDHIVSDLYLFLRSKMHFKYPSRDVKIEHCMRLAEVFDSKNKRDYSTPLMLNKRLITIQKACDSHENDALLAHCDPEHKPSGFLTAWAIIYFALLVITICLIPSKDKLILTKLIAIDRKSVV